MACPAGFSTEQVTSDLCSRLRIYNINNIYIIHKDSDISHLKISIKDEWKQKHRIWHVCTIYKTIFAFCNVEYNT